MRILWAVLGGGVGLFVGAIAGFCVALILMSTTKQPGGGTFGMMDVLVCVPSGALLGLIGAVTWVLTRTPPSP